MRKPSIRLVTFSNKIDNDLKKQLEDYCKESGRSIMWVLDKAIRNYLENQK